jgi:hypothetical protein
MPDTDSRLLVASPFKGAVAHRFVGRCNEFGLVAGFRSTVDGAELPSLSQVEGLCEEATLRGVHTRFVVNRGARVSDVRNRVRSGQQTNVSESMNSIPCDFRVCSGAQVPRAMADLLEKAT